MTEVLGSQLVITDRLGNELPITADPNSLTDDDIADIHFLASLFPGAAMIAGLQGSGKTMFMSWCAYNFKKLFNIDTVADFHFKSPDSGGSKMLYESYCYMDDEIFVNALEELKNTANVNKMARDKQYRTRMAEDTWKKIEKALGFNMSRKLILWDEVYQKMEKRRTSDPVGILYTHIILQFRHYYSTVLMATPDAKLVDWRGSSYLTHEIGCKWEENKEVITKDRHRLLYPVKLAHYRVYDRANMREIKPRVLRATVWGKLFDSYQPIAPRMRHIKSARK